MKSPLLILASCFAVGILAAHALSLSDLKFAWPPLLCLLAGFISLRRDQRRVSGILVLATFVLAGIVAAEVFQVRFAPNHIHHLARWNLNLREPLEIEGVVGSSPVRQGSTVSFDMNVREIEGPGPTRTVQGKVQVRIFIPPDRKSWAAFDRLGLRYGDLILAPIRFEKPTAYKNPGSFDFRWWMEAVKDISWEGVVESPLSVQKLAGSQAPKLSMLVEQVRARLLGGIDALYPPWSPEGRVGAVLKAVLLGDRTSLDSNTVENFRQSGLYHLLVISGLHVGLLAAVILFFLNLFHVGDSWRGAILIAFLATYALLVEQRAPTLRASLMIGAYLLARYLYRDRDALNAVGFAALVLLVYKPAWLFEAGFDLSFSAALLIAGLAIPILERTTLPYRRALTGLDKVHRAQTLPPRAAQLRLDLRSLIEWAKARLPFLGRHPALAERAVTIPGRSGLWIVDLMLFSAIIQVGLFMPMAATFHRITLVGIGLNALALPLMTVLIALAVPTVILSATLPALAVFPGKLLLWVTNALLATTELHRIPDWLSYRIPGPPAWVAVGFAVSLFAVAWSLGRRARVFKVSLGAFAVFAWVVVAYPFPAKLPRGRLETTALDCGRGEALFTVLPDGQTLLMDSGGRQTYGPGSGRWNPGEEIVSPYLWSRGVKTIDILVLGNGSRENIKALEAILRNFKVRELWRGHGIRSPAYQRLAVTARERGVVIRQLFAGNQKSVGQTKAEVLWPPLILPDSHMPLLDDALVVRIKDSNGSVLLRGNVDAWVARALARSLTPVASNILQTQRSLRASAAESEFMDRVNPQIVVISGKKYGRAGKSFPAYQTLHSGHVEVLRTGVDGAVTVDIDGARSSVRCYAMPERLKARRLKNSGAGA